MSLLGRAGSLAPNRIRFKSQACILDRQGLAVGLRQFSDLAEPQSPHFSNEKPNYHLPGVIVPFGLWQTPRRPVSFPPTEHRREEYVGKRIEEHLSLQQSERLHFCQNSFLAATADPSPCSSVPSSHPLQALPSLQLLTPLSSWLFHYLIG